MDLGKARSSDFTPHVNSTFRIHIEEEQFDLELVEVKEVGPIYEEDSKHRRQFALLFHCPRTDRILNQRTFDLQHDELGTLPLFLVPLEPGKDKTFYEVLIT